MQADRTYCDFLVFAPLDIEIASLEVALREDGWKIEEDRHTLFPKILNATLDDSNLAHSIRSCVIVQLNFQGVLNASVDAARSLEFYEPGYVVSFGIAGSLNSKDAPIGSVAWATSLIYYEPSKDIRGKTQSRSTPLPVGKDLLNHFRRQTFQDIHRIDGPVASGEKLFADVASEDRSRILTVNDKTLCVEMEAAGIAAAIAGLSRSSEVLIIKGISDNSDKAKNTASAKTQNINRTTAAKNAATCLSHLLCHAPLRRSFRSMPSFEDLQAATEADEEAETLASSLARFGIRCSTREVFTCLVNRRRPVPLYYHWNQLGPELQWVDFKILLAIRSLSRSVVVPVPIVTRNYSNSKVDDPWFRTVRRLLGVAPTTDLDLRRQQEELASHAQHLGFSRIEEEIRASFEDGQSAGHAPILINIMRFIIGQLCHKRFFVFTLRHRKRRWQFLSRILGFSFAIFEWDRFTLGGADGKRLPPGNAILIDPPSFVQLRAGIASCNQPAIVREFANQFDAGLDASSDPYPAIESLIESWSRLFTEQ